MSELRQFQPARILDVLARHQVRFVLIGGVAAQAHGSPIVTVDLDICYARDRDNLERLADALSELGAARRGLPDDAPRMPQLDTRTLRAGGLFTLATRFGDFDILASPDPGFDYERLLEHAVSTNVHGADIEIASLDDLIAMKRAAGRPKDRLMLEHLGALRQEIERRD